jgi:hypothetical protein
MADDPAPLEPHIQITPEQMAGVWSNFASVSHSPYEFTLDFVRLDFTQTPPQGIVVARVALSPLLVQQLTTALQDNWAKWAAKAMPPEVFGSERRSGESEADDDSSGADG